MSSEDNISNIPAGIPKDPLTSATEGVTTGTLKFGKELLKEWIQKFKDKNLSFIKDRETIDTAKEQYHKEELKIFRSYIKDKHLCILYQMGLTLRNLEKNNKPFDFLKTIKKRRCNK